MDAQNQILYFFDPLCGWCFGFSQTMQGFYHPHKNSLEFHAIPGGMITGPRVAPYRTMEAYIKGARPRLEETTGVQFGDAYIDKIVSSEIEMDSELPSRSLVTFRYFFPDLTMDYAHALQQKHFVEGRDYHDESVYRELAEYFKVDENLFMSRLHEDQSRFDTNQDFAWVNNAGIKGFPTVLLKSDQQYSMLSQGYTDLTALNEVLEEVLRAAQHDI